MRPWLLLIALTAFTGCKSTDCCSVAFDPCATPVQPCPSTTPATPQVEVQQQKEIHVQAKPQKVLVKRQAPEADLQSEQAQLLRAAKQAQSRVMLVPTTTLTPYVVAQANQVGTMLLQGSQADALIAQSGQRVVRRNARTQAALSEDESDEIQVDLRGLQNKQQSDETLKVLNSIHGVIQEQTTAITTMKDIIKEQQTRLQVIEQNPLFKKPAGTTVPSTLPQPTGQPPAAPSAIPPTSPGSSRTGSNLSLQSPQLPLLPQPESILMPSPVVAPGK